MTEFTQILRHYCRNPRCRSKLPSPASDPRKAFCTRGCHSSFYLKRCLVCENDKPAGSTARRKLCRRPKCEGRYRNNSADFDDRPWYIVAGPKITAAVYHCASVDPDIAARARVNDWDRIRRENAWCRRPPIPIDVTTRSRWEPCDPSVPDDLNIPDFLKREPAASPEGLAA